MRLNTLAPGKGFEKRVKWCGPSALAIITGRTLKYCHNKLAALENTKPRYLKGVSTSSMRIALRLMGYKVTRFDGVWHKTLRQYIEEHQRTAEFRKVMLINVTNHYVVAHRGIVQDNRDGPAPAAKHSSARKRIDAAWIVERDRK